MPGSVPRHRQLMSWATEQDAVAMLVLELRLYFSL